MRNETCNVTNLPWKLSNGFMFSLPAKNWPFLVAGLAVMGGVELRATPIALNTSFRNTFLFSNF